MRYSVLLAGKNRVIKEDLFMHFWSEFECLTCSGNYEDIRNHLKYYTPEALICCLLEEDSGSMQQVLSLRETIEKKKIALVLVGAKEDCNLFVQYAPGLASLVIEKPFTSSQVSDTMVRFLEKKKRFEKEQEEAEQRAQEHSQLLEEIAALKKKKILVIDDDPIMLKLMKEHLHEKYDVATAVSGKVARKFLSNKTADLIFLDYEMPEESGPEILEQLHKDEATKDIPVIFLTSIVDREKIQKALKFKPNGYLLKPIEHERLMETIKKQIG